MIRRYSVIILAAAALAACSVRAGYCQDNTTGTAPAKPELKWINGSVSQVEFVKSFLLVNTELGYLTFTVDDKTSISIGPDKVDLSDIQPEDSVRIQYYSPEPGQYIAVSVTETKKTSDQ